MWCRRSCDTPGYEKSPSVLPPWGFFHKSTVPIISQKTGHSGTSFPANAGFEGVVCKYSMNKHHFAAPGKMVPPDFVDLNQIAAGDDLPPPAKREPTTFCRQYHFVGSTQMVPTIPVTSPPWCRIPKFFDPPPIFRGQRAEVLQNFLHLENFWGFGTRIAPARGHSTFPAAGGEAGQSGQRGRRQAGEGRG